MVSERHFALKKRSGYASTSARVHARTRMHAQARAHAHAWADEHARMHTTSLPVQPEYGCCWDDKRNLARHFGSLDALEKRRCGHMTSAPVQLISQPMDNHLVLPWAHPKSPPNRPPLPDLFTALSTRIWRNFFMPGPTVFSPDSPTLAISRESGDLAKV